ncbi:MerR family transcriptional regulator [Patulibacter minatonensis]|uniref:MerR family transcriptional regulator n=1 Tax=Patulibacter minatonensis TaxID=298163 RepID=UPI0004B65BFC|nr:MerR family transcriptional regulator [Patulibacter minatonensis]
MSAEAPDITGLLRMGDLADQAGVSPATVKHYLREGLLESESDAENGVAIVRTSRNMAYYPPAFVERIRLVRRLQEERFMPLRAIREVLSDGPDRARELVGRRDEIIERALSRRDGDELTPRADLIASTGVPASVLDKFAELRVMGDGVRGYDPDEVRIVQAFLRFRDTGFGDELGFTVYDALRYVEALEPLVREETQTFLHRMVDRDVDPERAVELMLSATDPLRELVGAVHGHVLRRELERERRTD